MTLAPGDDGFHRPGQDQLWQEAWSFEWSADGGAVAGFARHAFSPHLGEAWLWIYCFVGGRIVAVRDHDVPLGDRWGRHEHRGTGLWWDFRPQEPMQAWSLQAETMGIAVATPEELIGERGLPMPLGLDISFEAISPAAAIHRGGASGRYRQFGSWSGEVLVGADRLALNGLGERDHSWGRWDGWTGRWTSVSFHTGPDRAAHVAERDGVVDGYVWSGGDVQDVVGWERDRDFVAGAHMRIMTDGAPGVGVVLVDDTVVPIPIESRGGEPASTLGRGPARFDVEGTAGQGAIELTGPP